MTDIDGANIPQSFWRLVDIYGEIFQLELPGRKINWGVAHRLLMPVFGPIGIRKASLLTRVFDGMMNIASQLLLRWDRYAYLFNLEASMLNFDMIGLCAFGFRFNNFYSEKNHPFIEQMSKTLRECGMRASKPALETKFRIFSAQKTVEDIAAMHSLYGGGGGHMTEEKVRFNMVTFLVTGHETTSGTLGFLFYHPLKNPKKYMAAQKEVDKVLGDGTFEAKHLSQLPYIKYCIYETLRFMGPISMIMKHAKKPTKIGENAEEFILERFLNGGFEKLPLGVFKPFGDGERACIGRAFAEQEMVIVVALILQKFQVEAMDPNYELKLKVSLTVKADDLRIRVRRRPSRTLGNLQGAPAVKPQVVALDGIDHDVTDRVTNSMRSIQEKPITILYGSQSGTCKTYAEELQSNAPRFGFKASLGTLDSATEHVPKNQPVIIIAPSYEGQPSPNSKLFVSWLETNASSKLLNGVKYAVLGVGNSDWADTFHRVPKLIDGLFQKMGAQGFTNTGFVDVKYDVIGPYEDWADAMWQDLRNKSGTTTEVIAGVFEAKIAPPAFVSRLDGEGIGYGIVKANKELCGSAVGLPKKHLEVELPVGSSYRAGDYLVVLPMNSIAHVKRIWKRFNISPDDSITVTGTNKAILSPGTPLSVFDLMMTRVELATPASQKRIQALAETSPEKTRDELLQLTKDDVYRKQVLERRCSVLDLLEVCPDSQLPFPVYLDMLKPLTPRQYSISSSPLANVQFVESEGRSTEKLNASITFDAHDEPAWSGRGNFRGVASTYLARQEVGERVRCFTRPTNVDFHLLLNPKVPIVMVCAGSGLAPMLGFMEEREVITRARNQELGPEILYFGCRHYEKDFIYADELRRWEEDGSVSVRPCFSKVGPSSGTNQKHVPDRMWEEREELKKSFSEYGAKSTAQVCKKIYIEPSGATGKEVDEWFDGIKEERYISDVFE
ncbi:cytochrome P450 [Lojkania enalia]|uniref:Cytochrome P450 n=1 Tax=Lojkania enalia TaxID=147567 RepID=A0A9P4K6V7_9PLEO|nr:cytochrome P450 [Didymosphaeria enalia]